MNGSPDDVRANAFIGCCYNQVDELGSNVRSERASHAPATIQFHGRWYVVVILFKKRDDVVFKCKHREGDGH